jgi:hypothetical protein
MKPRKWYWESGDRYYFVMAHTDLFGNVVITKQWGGLNNNLNGSKTELVEDDNLDKVIKDIHSKRTKRDYVLIDGQ